VFELRPRPEISGTLGCRDRARACSWLAPLDPELTCFARHRRLRAGLPAQARSVDRLQPPFRQGSAQKETPSPRALAILSGGSRTRAKPRPSAFCEPARSPLSSVFAPQARNSPASRIGQRNCASGTYRHNEETDHDEISFDPQFL